MPKQSNRERAWSSCHRAQSVVLDADSLGMSRCIVISFADIALRTLLNLPDEISPYIILTLGCPGESPEPPPRRSVADIAFADEYGKALS